MLSLPPLLTYKFVVPPLGGSFQNAFITYKFVVPPLGGSFQNAFITYKFAVPLQNAFITSYATFSNHREPQ
ncbi:hypothetical protein QUF72_23670, partial [Desulfobacterales bacterium HSG2]|nr:hypothetical protein [Desulfobacterales bacterium HSG2]